EGGRLARRLHVEDEVDVALLVAEHVLRAVFRDGRKAERLEQLRELVWIGRGEFDELETVSAQRVFENIGHENPSTFAKDIYPPRRQTKRVGGSFSPNVETLVRERP